MDRPCENVTETEGSVREFVRDAVKLTEDSVDRESVADGIEPVRLRVSDSVREPSEMDGDSRVKLWRPRRRRVAVGTPVTLTDSLSVGDLVCERASLVRLAENVLLSETEVDRLRVCVPVRTETDPSLEGVVD